VTYRGAFLAFLAARRRKRVIFQENAPRAPFGDTIRRKLTRKRLSVAPSCAQTAGNRKTPEFFVVRMSFGFIRRQFFFVIDVV
jgi:hypothetical protein